MSLEAPRSYEELRTALRGFVPFAMLGFLYVRAYRVRAALGLDALEVLDTRYQIVDHFAVAAVGVLSCIVVNIASPAAQGLAGWVYFLLGPIKTGIGVAFGRRRTRVERALAAGPG